MDFNTKNFRYEAMAFGDFIERLNGGERMYLRSLSRTAPVDTPALLQVDYPELAEDFILPPELSLVDENIFSSVLRVSGNVSMWLHYDVRPPPQVFWAEIWGGREGYATARK